MEQRKRKMLKGIDTYSLSQPIKLTKANMQEERGHLAVN